MNKIKYLGFAVLAFFGIVSTASATEYSTSTIATTFGGVLDDIVNTIIDVFVTFLSSNLPIIVVLSVSIGIVFWLIRKARRAGTGN